MPAPSLLPGLLRAAKILRIHLHILFWGDYGSPLFKLGRNLLLLTVVSRAALVGFRELRARGGVFGTARDVGNSAARKFFRVLLEMPGIREKKNAELAKNLAAMEDSMVPSGPSITRHLVLPEHGWTTAQVLAEMQALAQMEHSDWLDGKVSGAVYHGTPELLRLQAEAYQMFAPANQLHPDVFPGVRQMEAEVVNMVLRLYNAPEETGCGTATSGGTESLLMACLAAKMYGYHERGITAPEIVAPVTVHAGFDKAAYYFGMKLRHAPIDPVTYKVDLKAVKRLVTANTVLIVGSAPNFPHGIIDDIEGLSVIALHYGVLLHVDACLGSFVSPYLDRVYSDLDLPDVKVPLFDFRVPGVTSISCDTHKYGFAPKGSSVIMYRTAALRKCQYFLATDWSGGIYASPTLAGSRPGALMAGCWASLMYMGDDGYLASATKIVCAARAVREGIAKQVPEVYVLGNPISSVVAFSSHELNIYDVADRMTRRGWHLSALQNPAALHIACTQFTIESCNQLVADLREVVDSLLAESAALGEDDKMKAIKAKQGDTAMLYGVAGSVSTAGVVDELAIGFLDNLFKAYPTTSSPPDSIA
ncbi:pyridoxal phosphate-dependent transferase [Limtongia smithiae]|uniref:pyridoxal phosphate-dependent transferase n=1 Tax=Limtongia smithiae TaxID=1125753 RepID=UPI0034CE7DAB